jgi:hypothetical protein
MFITDINVRPIYCGIWQNLDSENQHQSNNRLFQYSYRYGLHWTLCSSEYCCFSLILALIHANMILCAIYYHNIVFTDIFLLWYGIGSWMFCLCPNWFWKNPCICGSHAHEAQGIGDILSSCCCCFQHPVSWAPIINFVYRLMQKMVFELL